MAKKSGGYYSAQIEKPKKKRKGVHSKNASKGQNKYKKVYIGQGR